MSNERPPWATRFHGSQFKPIPGKVWEALRRGEIGWGKALSQHEKEPTLQEALAGWNEYLESKEIEEEPTENNSAILYQINSLVAQVVGE